MTPRSFAIVTLALAWIGTGATAQTLRGVTESSSYSRMENGKVTGPANEIVEATLKQAGFNDYNLALYPWARAYDMALQEPNVLIYLIARTPEREAQFKWAGEFMRVEYYLYKLRDQKDVNVRSLQDAKNYTIAVMRDDLRHQYLQAQGFTKLVISSQVGDNFKKLANRQAQLAALSEAGAAQFCEDTHTDCATLEKVYTLDALSVGLYMAYSKQTADDIVTRTRVAFEKVKASGFVAKQMSLKR